MAADLDIINLALSHIGDKATVSSIDPPDGSVQADHAARFYPMVRDWLLERHQWGFSVMRTTLPLLDFTATAPWRYAYGVPAGVGNLLAVMAPDATADSQAQPYVSEMVMLEGVPTKAILTDQEGAVLRYTASMSDASQFSPLFTMALSRFLAAALAGPILKGDVGRAEGIKQAQMGEQAFLLAAESDANQQLNKPQHVVPWAMDRFQPPYSLPYQFPFYNTPR